MIACTASSLRHILRNFHRSITVHNIFGTATSTPTLLAFGNNFATATSARASRRRVLRATPSKTLPSLESIADELKDVSSEDLEELSTEEKESLMKDVLSLESPSYKEVQLSEIRNGSYTPLASHVSWVDMKSVNVVAAIPHHNWRVYHGQGRLLGSVFDSWTAGCTPPILKELEQHKETHSANEFVLPISLTINKYHKMLGKNSPVAAAAHGKSDALVRALMSLHMVRHGPNNAPAEDALQDEVMEHDAAAMLEEQREEMGVKPIVHKTWRSGAEADNGVNSAAKTEIFGAEYSIPTERDSPADNSSLSSRVSVTFVLDKVKNTVHEVTFSAPANMWNALGDGDDAQPSVLRRQQRRAALFGKSNAKLAELQAQVGLGNGLGFTSKDLLENVVIQSTTG